MPEHVPLKFIVDIQTNENKSLELIEFQCCFMNFTWLYLTKDHGDNNNENLRRLSKFGKNLKLTLIFDVSGGLLYFYGIWSKKK